MPHYLVPREVLGALVVAVDRYSRSNPTSAKLITTSAQYPGVAGLLRAMKDEAPEAAAFRSQSDPAARSCAS